VEVKAARGAARRMPVGQLGRPADPPIDDVERVARAVPTEGRARPYRHDIPERADQTTERAPTDAWARQHIVAARRENGETASVRNPTFRRVT
jgi:hypothetical protein